MDSPRILLVDDSETQRELWRTTIRAAWPQARLQEAEDAREALGRMRLEAFDLILADHHMAGMTGIELLEVVYREHPDVLRVMVTGVEEFEVAREAINRAHVHAFLPKGAGVDVLRERLGMLLKAKKS